MKLKKYSIIALFIMINLCNSYAKDTIIIKGSDTLGAKMVPQLSEKYKEFVNNNIDFEVAAEGSSTAFSHLLSHPKDIGMSSRDVKGKEVEDFKNKGFELKEWLAGYDMIGVIVNKKNNIKNLTLDQVREIFTGEVTDWSEVGGRSGQIFAYTRNTSSGTYKSFQKMAMNKEDYGDTTRKLAGNEQIAEEVANNVNGIGYVGLAYIGKEGIKTVSIDGVKLTPENASKYPISRSIYYYTVKGKTTTLGLKFLDWATTSKDAKNVVFSVGFIPPK